MELLDQLDRLAADLDATVTIQRRHAHGWHASVVWASDPEEAWRVDGGGSGAGHTLREAIEAALGGG